MEGLYYNLFRYTLIENQNRKCNTLKKVLSALICYNVSRIYTKVVMSVLTLRFSGGKWEEGVKYEISMTDTEIIFSSDHLF